MFRALPATLLVMAAALAAPTPLAQVPEGVARNAEVHRLEIRDGRLHHDGRPLPAEAIPAELDVEGLTLTFEYSGPVMPALTLNGRVYALEGDRLMPMDEAATARQAQAVAVVPPTRLGADPAASRQQAAQAYLDDLSERDRALYERIVRESDLEVAALRLASRIRTSTDEAERAELRAELRRRLDAIFELKQENRREEVAQVEAMLHAMLEQLREREAMREAIVRERMRELTGQ